MEGELEEHTWAFGELDSKTIHMCKGERTVDLDIIILYYFPIKPIKWKRIIIPLHVKIKIY
jgi:hypothetical protein